MPLCLSSYRSGFVNRYSSVRVRPGDPSGLWCNSSISAREADGPGANPGFLTNLDGPLRLGYLVSGQPRAGSNPAPSGNWWVPNSLFVRHIFGPKAVGYLAKWQSTGLISRSCRFDPCDPDAYPLPNCFSSNNTFDGSQDWVIAS